jgi:hypothetical protein
MAGPNGFDAIHETASQDRNFASEAPGLRKAQ